MSRVTTSAPAITLFRDHRFCALPADDEERVGRQPSPPRNRASHTVARTAGDLLRQLATRATRFDRRPAARAVDTKKVLVAAMQQILDGATESALSRYAWHLTRVAALHGAVGAAAVWFDALEAGLELINRAHREALRHGVRAHAARGLAQTLALAAKHPRHPLHLIRAMAVTLARADYEAQALADRLHRGGATLHKDTEKRNRRFEGRRDGIELALCLLGPLSTEQRHELAELAQKQGAGSVDEGFARLARPAVGADSIHARPTR